MKNKLLTILLVIGCMPSFSQQIGEVSPFEFSGYVKDVQTVFVPHQADGNWLSDNSFHNRLRLKYYPMDWLTAEVQARNRLVYGDFVKILPDYSKNAFSKGYFVKLHKAWLADSSVVGLSEIDRFFVQFTKANWEVTIGRQRINWGLNLVWNPNDVFNTYSYFDFEYEERPGTDAISVKYYTSYTSSAQLVYKAGSTFSEMALAGLYRFNKWNFDFQVLGGLVKSDYVGGVGFSGNIYGAALRGETTVFHPKADFRDTASTVVTSISADYTFESTLYMQCGMLHNSAGKKQNAGALSVFSNEELSPKNLSRGRFNIFYQISYNISPLVTTGVSAILNPDDMSAFISPTVNVFVSNNMSVSLMGQFFYGSKQTEFGNIGKMGVLRFKYSF
ncbi:MAG: hypothetical protein PF489_04275 [Salinivirgaceae bacterium]|jgi:hypothetical protein|nr:hypothetical protein [Salinivirgaceae bacterium]